MSLIINNERISLICRRKSDAFKRRRRETESKSNQINKMPKEGNDNIQVLGKQNQKKKEKTSSDIRHRNTHQRELILRVVRARCDHPTAEEIYKDVKRLDDKIGKATVYRNLNTLADFGEINHIRVPSGVDRFDLRNDLHYHIICTACGALEDVPLAYKEEDDWLAERETGYKVKRHRGVFEGICPNCLKAQKA